jgi:hypothetical protein
MSTEIARPLRKTAVYAPSVPRFLLGNGAILCVRTSYLLDAVI